MTCPRCGRRNAALSWYCRDCGTSLINAVDGGRWRQRWRWWVGLVVFVALVGGAAVVLRAGVVRQKPAGFVDDPGESTRTAAATSTTTPAAGVEAVSSTPPADLSGVAIATRPAPDAAVPALSALTATVVAAAMIGLAGSRNAAEPAAAGAASEKQPLIPVREGAPVWSAALAKQPPHRDGWLDDWPGPPLSLDAVVLGAQARRDAADLSGEAYVAWTASMLGLAVHVVDDQFIAPPTGSMLGQGDSVELQLDTDLAGDWSSGIYSADDWQIGLSPGDLAGRSPEAYVSRPGPARALAGARMAARRVVDGYTIEVEIPWTELGISPKSLTSLGIAVNLIDRDTAGAAPLTVVSSSPRRTPSDPRTFGTLLLAGEGGAGLIEGGRPHGVAP